MEDVLARLVTDLLAATSITVKNGRLELENYGQEPVKLTSITEEEKKAKK